MHCLSERSLLSLSPGHKVVPAIKSRQAFVSALDSAHASVETILLRNCNLFEFAGLLDRSYHRGILVYVNVDHIDGIQPDATGLHYLADHFHVTGIISSNPKTLALARNIGLETVQRIFALDSTGLESSLESIDTHYIDLLDISPALVVPHIKPQLLLSLPLPFIASGLIDTLIQIEAVLRSGALRVVVSRPELWQQASAGDKQDGYSYLARKGGEDTRTISTTYHMR
jgi:glycerol uptake operon antiterminator